VVNYELVEHFAVFKSVPFMKLCLYELLLYHYIGL
jgi:hypothetical protein